MQDTTMDKHLGNTICLEDLEFLSRTAAELFGISSEQNIYELIGLRVKEIAGSAIVAITEYDQKTGLFHIRSLKGLGDVAEHVVKQLKQNPEKMVLKLNDEIALASLLTGKMVEGPDNLYELLFKSVPRAVCLMVEKLLNIGRIYAMGFVCQGEMFGDAVLICRQGENETLVARNLLLIETFINQAALALHRKKVEMDREKRERRFRALIKNSSDSITILNQDGIQVYVSDVVEKMLGYHPAELINIPVIEQMIHPEDQGHVMAAFARILQEGKGGAQYRHRHKNGHWVYLEAWGTNQLDNPDIRGVVVNVRDITERKNMENELRKSEEAHRSFIDHAPIGIMIIHLDGEISYLNRKSEDIIGYKKEQWTGKSVYSIVFADDAARLRQIIGQGPQTLTDSISNEIRIYNSKKEIRWIKISSEPVYDLVREEKILTGMQFFIEDITLIKRVKDINRTLFAISTAVTITKDLPDLYKSIHGLLGEVFDVTNFFLALVDTNKRTIHFPYHVDVCDDDFLPLVNFDEKDSLSGLVVSNKKPVLLKQKQLEERAAQKGIWGPVPLIWMGAPLMIREEVTGVIAVQSYSNPEQYNEQDLQVLASVSDQVAIAIERKTAEDELKKSQMLFKLITENTSALVSILDANANYIFASPSHEQLGFKPEELIGKPGFTLMVEEDIAPLREYFKNAGKQKTSRAFLNYRLKDKKDRMHYFSGLFDAVCKPDRTIESIVYVGEDITELRKAQSEKMEALSLAAKAEKLALVGQIAGKMAHDFNNILGVIMGHTELALLDCPDELTRKTLELIFEQTLRGKNLTKNLVAFAKDQEPKQEFFLIDEKLELVINLLKKDLEGIHVIRQYDYGLPELVADPGMMEHAIVNLIQNSIHALSLSPHPQIILRTYSNGEFIVFEIEDNGCGIPSEYIGLIFEPSFTLKGSKDKTGIYKSGIKGTGYGMSNVKKYVEQHKGDISIRSEVNKGTTVVISLPVIKKELTMEEIQRIEKLSICSGQYILLVEDEQAIADVQYQILTKAPFRHRVDMAGSGRVAMDLLDRNQYDLISLDYMLPGGINGMEVYRHIRKKDQTVPVLFISGNIEFLESIKDLKQKDPFVDHLSKPCRNMDYLQSINQLFFN